MKERLYFENPINLVLISAMKFFLPLSCHRHPHRRLVILGGGIRYRADSSGYTRRAIFSFFRLLSSLFLACYLFHIFSPLLFTFVPGLGFYFPRFLFKLFIFLFVLGFNIRIFPFLFSLASLFIFPVPNTFLPIIFTLKSSTVKSKEFNFFNS